MALRKCMECGYELAKSTPTCPRCGVTSPSQGILEMDIPGGCLVGVFIFVILMAVLSDLGYMDSRSSTPSDSVPGAIVRYTHGSVNVFEGRGTYTAVLRTLPAGQHLEVTDRESEWWVAHIDGQRIGYIADSLLHSTAPDAGAPR